MCISLLPPGSSTLKMHILRANYQAFIWKHSDEQHPEIPTPDTHGWKMVDGKLAYEWCDGDIMPKVY
jgi:hypothetical protein